jgi:hypothetical protein
MGSGDAEHEWLPFEDAPPFKRNGTQDCLGASTGVAFGAGTGNGGVAGVSPAVAWTHGKVSARSTPVTASVVWICDLTCGACYDGSCEIVIVIVTVSEIGHRMLREW